jgi:antitoxin (DNA-binding transcriptional repressor) of toxin-antitoxin stability system
MKTISKSKLKSQMLKIFREIEETGEEVIVTDHNQPVLKVVLYNNEQTVTELFKDVQGKVGYHQDINQTTEDEWDHKDPADRTIVATSMIHKCPLLTSDQKILSFYSQAVW